MISRPVRLAWLLFALCVAFPLTATANGLLAADLDGDGRSDYVVTDHREPHVLHVWLSSTDTTQIIRTKARAQQIAAADLDGDRQPELIWRNGVKLHVLKRAAGRFKHVRARHVAPRPQAPRDLPNANDRNTDLPATSSVGSVDPAAVPRALNPAPPESRCMIACRVGAGLVRPRHATFAFVPRPPPYSC